MIVLDTSVLVYALGADHALRPKCRLLLDVIGDGRVKATTTIQVIQEFTHVRARRRTRGEAVADAAEYAALLAPLRRPSETDQQRALELFVEHPQLGAFDAMLAATVLGATHLTAVVSADRAFSAVAGLVWIDPADGDLVERAVAQG